MDRLARIVGLDNEIQARLVDGILAERRIPHILKSYHDSAYDGVFQNSSGWGHIEAPASFRDEIIAIVADIKRQASSASADEPEP